MFNLDDPRTVALLSMAGGLLTPVRGKGGAAFGQALSQGIQGGLLGHQSAQQMQMRKQQADMARQMQEAQMAEFTRGQDFNKALSAGYSPGVTPATPVDDSGFQMPRSAPQMDFSGAMQIDPLKGMQAQASWQQMNAKAGPQFKEVGGRLVRIDGSSVSEAYAPPEKPIHQKGQTREIKAGRRILTQEYDGAKWNTISTSLMDKPDAPDKGPAAPQGYRWSGDKLEPIPGGPADAKVGKEAEALKRRQEGAIQRADFVLGKVREAVDQSGVTTTGPVGAIARNIPGTGGYNLNKTIDAIKANIGFGELQAMREASPTGGALGQVAVQELNMLQSVLGSLDTAQSQDQLLKSLYAIEKHYTNWKRAVEGSGKESGGTAAPAPKPGTVDSGYYFKGGDPADHKNWVKRK